MFEPLVQECEVTDGIETYRFWVRQASGMEILTAAGSVKKDKLPVENARDLFSKYIVQEDGTPISREEVDKIFRMRIEQMQEVSHLVQDKIGLKKVIEKNT